MSEFLIHELAERAGVTVRTIRFYAAEGLLPAPIIKGKYAYYTDEHLDRLELIQKLKDLHLPLREIRTTLNTTRPEEVRQKLEKNMLQEEASPPPASQARFPSPAGKQALEYITRVKNIREGLSRPDYSSEPPVSPAPSRQPPTPAQLPGKREVLKGEEIWRRMSLAPGVELNMREPVDPESTYRLQKLVEFAQQLFQHHPKGGNHE